MNIFDIYLDKIKSLIRQLNEEKLINLPESLNSINVEIPPENFDCDISTNVSMVLSKVNNKSPLVLGNQLIEYIINQPKKLGSFREFLRTDIDANKKVKFAE